MSWIELLAVLGLFLAVLAFGIACNRSELPK